MKLKLLEYWLKARGRMPNTLKKKQIELQIFGQGNGNGTVYTGRLLGLLSPKEYNAIFIKPELRNKITTVETTALLDIGNMEDIEGLRLAMVVKKHNDKPISEKLLFISEPLEHISSLDASSSEISLSGGESYFVITEKEEDV